MFFYVENVPCTFLTRKVIIILVEIYLTHFCDSKWVGEIDFGQKDQSEIDFGKIGSK